MEPAFRRYIGIDYSGAETADSSCKGLRVYAAEGTGMLKQVQPPPSPRRYLPSECFLGDLTNSSAANTGPEAGSLLAPHGRPQKYIFQLVAKNGSERHYIYERFCRRRWRGR